MIYLFAAYIVGSLALIAYLVKNCREQMKDLQDRIMALTKPEALVTKEALDAVEEDDVPSVRYVDEKRQYELQEKIR